MDKIIAFVQKMLGIADLKGGVVMGIYSLSMIYLSFYSVKYSKPIDSSVAAMYIAIAGFYGGSKIHANWLGMKKEETNADTSTLS